MRHAANIEGTGVHRMREQSGHRLPGAVRHRHGLRESSADDTVGGVLPRDWDQGVASVQREDTGTPLPRQRRPLMRAHLQRRQSIFHRHGKVNWKHDPIIYGNEFYFRLVTVTRNIEGDPRGPEERVEEDALIDLVKCEIECEFPDIGRRLGARRCPGGGSSGGQRLALSR